MSRPTDIPESVWEWADIFCDEHRAIEDDRELVARAYMLASQPDPTPSRLGLTVTQSKGLEFIEAYQKCYGASPSFSEIAEGLGFRSKSPVHAMVRQLVDRGVVTMAPRRSRSLAIVGRN